MKTRVFIFSIGTVMAVWVLISFGGVMINTANAEFWTTSLMWALLSSIVVMPALVVLDHYSSTARRKESAQDSHSESSSRDRKPFVGQNDRDRVLWPRSEEK